MAITKMLNEYLSGLAVWNIKLHNLHWNVKGLQFIPVHQYTEKLYEKAFENFDDVAELIKISGEEPLVSLEDYLKNSPISEKVTTDFSTESVLKTVSEDIKIFRKKALEIRNAADEVGNFTAVALFEGYIAEFDKDLWFLRQMGI